MNNINNSSILPNTTTSFQYYENIITTNPLNYFFYYDCKKKNSSNNDNIAKIFDRKFRKVEFNLFLSKLRFGFRLSDEFPTSVGIVVQKIVRSIFNAFTNLLFSSGNYIILSPNVCSCGFQNVFFCHFKFGQFFCLGYNGKFYKYRMCLDSPRFVFVFSDDWCTVKNIGCYEESKSKEDYLTLLNDLLNRCKDATMARNRGQRGDNNQNYMKVVDFVKKNVEKDDSNFKNRINHNIKYENESKLICEKCYKFIPEKK